jgi:hypothetical protein
MTRRRAGIPLRARRSTKSTMLWHGTDSKSARKILKSQTLLPTVYNRMGSFGDTTLTNSKSFARMTSIENARYRGGSSRLLKVVVRPQALVKMIKTDSYRHNGVKHSGYSTPFSSKRWKNMPLHTSILPVRKIR